MIEDTHNAYLQGGLRKISPFFVPGSIINMISGLVSIHYGYQGPNLATVSACSSANHSLGEARLIEYGDADVMSSGAEGTVSPLGIGGLSRAHCRIATTTPRRRAGPGTSTATASFWEKAREVLVLEELEHAKGRGARIYCELVGGMPARRHITAPEDGRRRAKHGQRAEKQNRCAISTTSTRTVRRRSSATSPVCRGQALLRRACVETGGLVDQIDDRTSALRRRRGQPSSPCSHCATRSHR